MGDRTIVVVLYWAAESGSGLQKCFHIRNPPVNDWFGFFALSRAIYRLSTIDLNITSNAPSTQSNKATARYRDLDLRQYGISPISVSLLETKPLEKLPDPLYSPWESIVDDLPQLIKTDTLSDAVNNHPALSTAKPRTEE